MSGFSSFGPAPEKDKKSNEYYTGGHSSGVAVQGRDETGAHVTERLTQQVRENNVVGERPADVKQPSFLGQGQSLDGRKAEGEKKREQPVVRVLTMYEDGFTVDKGPFRSFTDPANKEFLDEVGKGIIPRELEQEAHGSELHVDLVDKRTEKFKAQPQEKPKVEAFAGHAQSLGGGGSNANSNVASSKVQGQMAPVDTGKETTQIQVRMKDGSRVVGTFNPDTHTVADILRFLASKGHAGGSLMCTMPRKTFQEADFNLTIAQAQLKGASLMLQ